VWQPAPVLIKMINFLKNSAYYISLILAAVFHFLLTAVVALFIISSLNIINRTILHFESLKYIEIMVLAAVFLVSLTVYLRSFRKIAVVVKKTFFQ
jgi:hypothetical protein